MTNSRWQEAQASEARCWRNVKEKITSKEYLERKEKYWDLIFKKINDFIKVDESKTFLDFGCGPTGIVLKYKDKKNLTCVDPLMNKYLEINPHLENYKSNFVNSKIEDFSGKKFDYIFGFNSLDHSDSLENSINSLFKLMNKESYLIISINCHNLGLFQKIMLKTSFIFDKPHLHQYTLNQYVKMFEKKGFDIIKTINIDDELDFMFNFEKEKNKANFKKFLRKIFYPFSIMSLFGYRQYGKEKEKTIYSSNIIIVKLK
jgi:2-polyprenyl-3-methyl-5-hydroxy-6-metoxy-1,4-benzoquinol methylase